MSTTTIPITFKVGGVLTDATSIVLSDDTGTYSIVRTDTGANVAGIAVDTAFVHDSEGIYHYSFTDPAADLTYTVYVKYVYGGVTSYTTGTFLGGTGGAGTRNAAYWTRTTLAQQLMVEIPACGRGPNGAVPTALSQIVLQSIGDVETRKKWRWRAGNGTFDTVAASATYRLTNNYSDFGKLLSEVLTETSGNGTITVTADVDDFRGQQYRYLTASSDPVLAVLEPDTALSEFGWQFRFVPTPSAARTYRFDYKRTMATLGLTDVPTWPAWMNWLWYLGAKWQSIYTFDRTRGDWAGPRKLYLDEVDKAFSEQNNPEESQLVRICDGYGDYAAFASNGLALGGGWLVNG